MIMLHSADFILSQEGDCNDDAQQELRITLEEGGAGPFMTLRTQRWAFDHPAELSALLDRIHAGVAPIFTAEILNAPLPATSD